MNNSPEKFISNKSLAIIVGNVLSIAGVVNNAQELFNTKVDSDQIPTSSLVAKAMGLETVYQGRNQYDMSFRENLLSDKATLVRGHEADNSYWHEPENIQEWVSVKVGNITTSALGIGLIAGAYAFSRKKKSTK